MQAIETKYIGPTDFNGSRIKAISAAKSIILSWDDSLGIEQNHELAALYLANKLGWMEKNLLFSGTLKNGNYVHVLVQK